MKCKYSADFKQSTVQKILMPGGPSAKEMSVRTGAHITSINDWIKIYGKPSDMKQAKDWTPENKLKAIAQTFSMNENELGEFLRSNGLHLEELEQWKQDFFNSQMTANSVGRPKVDRELVQLRIKEKELTKNLRRKDRALAEMTARVVLLKKSHAIFGDTEEDE
jgi:transposase-like protein